jgi:hypothetical protein
MIKKLVLIFVLAIIGFLGYGFFDYFRWEKAKSAIALGGYPWECGAYQVTTVTKGCNLTSSGACVGAGVPCAMCEEFCLDTTQVIFAGQPGCMGAEFACISPDVIETGVQLAFSRQAILAGPSNLMTANSVLATQSIAGYSIEKFANWFKYIIAGHKDKVK